jgi:hypothetical protein
MFWNDIFNCFHVFFGNALEACFKCSICLETYVANISSGCFKSRSGVAAEDSPTATAAAGRRWVGANVQAGGAEGARGKDPDVA